jgi:hypothetical protein
VVPFLFSSFSRSKNLDWISGSRPEVGSFEDQQFGLVDHGLDDGALFFVAHRKFSDVPPRIKVEKTEEIPDPVVVMVGMVESCSVFQEFNHLHAVVYAGIGGHIPDAVSDLFGILYHIQPKDGGIAGSGKDEVQQDADGG